MIKKILMMLSVTMPILSAWALKYSSYTINPDSAYFYFYLENEKENEFVRSISTYNWYSLYVSRNEIVKSSTSSTVAIYMKEKYLTVQDVGLTIGYAGSSTIDWQNASFDYKKDTEISDDWFYNDGLYKYFYTFTRQNLNLSSVNDTKNELNLFVRLRWYRFNLHLDPNGGSLASADSIYDIPYKVSTGDKDANGYLEYTENTVSLPNPERTGYTFSGWARQGGSVSLKDQVKSSDIGVNTDGEDITLTAKWIANTYTLTFDSNGGTVSPTTQKVTYDSSYGELPVPTRVGYSFVGWYTKKSGGSQITAETEVSTADNHTVYAHWSANTYEIGYDNLFLYEKWAASESNELMSKPTGSTLYTSDIWSAELVIYSGTGKNAYTKYGNTSYFYNIPVQPNTEYTFSCTLTGNAPSSEILWVPLNSDYEYLHSGKWGPYIGMGTSGGATEYVRTFTTPTDCAYVQIFFDVHDPNQTENFKDIRLCKTNPYGSVSVSTVREAYTYNVNSTYGNLETPFREGYVFKGWFTSENGGTEVKSTSIVQPYSTSLYSRWNPASYTVYFNANGGSVSESDKTVVYNSTYGELPVPTREGYTFNGWFTKSSDGIEVKADTKVAITGSQTLYAQWKAEMRTVIFYNSDQKTVLLSTNVTYGTTINVPKTIDMHPGDVFKWWNDGNNTIQPGEELTVVENKSYYPVVEKEQTSLTAKVNPTEAGSIVYVNGQVEETGDAGRLVTITVGDLKPAYNFSGWSDGNKALTNRVEVISNMHLIANFTMKTNDVEFVGWNDEPLGVQSIPYGGSATNIVPPSYTGLSFVKWSTDAFTNNVTTGMKVQAQYETNRYTVVYNANGGYGSMTNDVFMYFNEYTLQSNAFGSTVSRFLGWSTDPNATTNEVEYEDCAIVSNLTDVANGTNTLYAVWQSLLTPYSIAANCTNLMLECTNEKQAWLIDNTFGYASDSSIYASGISEARLSTEIEGVGTLTFRLKISTKSKEGNNIFGLYEDSNANKDAENDFINESLDGEWILCTVRKTDSNPIIYTWYFNGKSDDDEVYIDQVRWYPGKTVNIAKIDRNDANARTIENLVLLNWNDILGESASTVESATIAFSNTNQPLSSLANNAVALLGLGYAPAYTVEGTTATLTFTNAPDLAIGAFELDSDANVSLSVSVTNTSWGLPDWSDGVEQSLAVWGSPTLTTGWSRVESECNLSRYLTEGVALFDFNVGTNKFFKVKAE